MDYLFGGNVFKTPCGQLVEQATGNENSGENWQLYMELCDNVSMTEEGPKDCVRAIRKRLSQLCSTNSTPLLLNLLTVLETCVKNCSLERNSSRWLFGLIRFGGHRFHVQVAQKDFLQELINLISPKYNQPLSVQERVLGLLESWAEAFRNVPELREFDRLYQELKSKGIEFPATNLDAMAPIHTPARSVPVAGAGLSMGAVPVEEGVDASAIMLEEQARHDSRVSNSPGRGDAMASRQQAMADQQQTMAGQQQAMAGQQQAMAGQQQAMTAAADASGGGVNLTPAQVAKLHKELAAVETNCRVLNDMLTELKPGQETQEELQLLVELETTCREMQNRMARLIVQLSTDDLIGDLLRINDDLNNAFVRCDRYKRQRQAIGSSAATTATSAVPAAGGTALAPLMQPQPQHGQPKLNAASHQSDLISLDQSFQAHSIGPKVATVGGGAPASNAVDDFDMFAQSRSSFDQQRNAAASLIGSTATTAATTATTATTIPASANEHHEDQLSGLGTAMAARESRLAASTTDKPGDLAEMERWLMATPEQGEQATGATPAGTNPFKMEPSSTTGAISQSDFDRFLAERAGPATGSAGATCAGVASAEATGAQPAAAAGRPGHSASSKADQSGDPADTMFAL